MQLTIFLSFHHDRIDFRLANSRQRDQILLERHRDRVECVVAIVLECTDHAIGDSIDALQEV